MGTYLFNATGIWLVSLLAYDLLLRRESYHRYNRGYLICTLLAGFLLPALPWLHEAMMPQALELPVRSVAKFRESIVPDVVAAPSATTGLPWYAYLYGAGAGLVLLLLLADAAKIAKYYRRAQHSNADGWKIAETGLVHSPFSLRGILFVGNRQDYTAQEWHMILLHEGAHKSRWHMADLVLLYMARILLWFHPLVYIYHQRLRMVHEYEADYMARNSGTNAYGRFLIEQAVLNAGPSLAHSFNHSPIKQRIRMMTRTSGKIAQSKKLVLLLLLPFMAACFNNSKDTADVANDSTIITDPISGKKWVVAKDTTTGPKDTIIVTNPATGKEEMKIVDKKETVNSQPAGGDTIMVIDPVSGEEQMKVVSEVSMAGMAGGKISLDQLLANPTVQTTQKGCTVEGFVFSVLAKDEDLFGPFKVPGNKLGAAQLKYLRAHAGKKMTVYVEGIQLSCDGRERKTNAIAIKIDG
jgi:hypothetical protein